MEISRLESTTKVLALVEVAPGQHTLYPSPPEVKLFDTKEQAHEEVSAAHPNTAIVYYQVAAPPGKSLEEFRQGLIQAWQKVQRGESLEDPNAPKGEA